jgi:hypothetical protein
LGQLLGLEPAEVTERQVLPTRLRVVDVGVPDQKHLGNATHTQQEAWLELRY